MSAKNCLVVVYRSENDNSPYVVQCPKGTYFSKKDAQRVATAHVKGEGMHKAEVVEVVMAVNK